ncbi:MAG: 50S ribosomal protein L4 [Pirellulaceae bacterium]|nr:50S ribosomal protein L4 [Pirellulaceae bacterium]
MASLPIYDSSGVVVSQYEINLDQLSPRINRQLLHDVVVMYQANRRQGSASTRSRGAVAGSSQKMYRQKGTGNARAGAIRSGIRRGGGHIFAKKPRDFSYRLPRKAVQAATRMAIASKIRDDQIKVIDELAFDAPRTAAMAGILKALGLAGKTTLVATEAHDILVYKSSRNITGVTVSPVSDLNALSVLTPRHLLITKAALDRLQQQVASTKQEES